MSFHHLNPASVKSGIGGSASFRVGNGNASLHLPYHHHSSLQLYLLLCFSPFCPSSFIHPSISRDLTTTSLCSLHPSHTVHHSWTTSFSPPVFPLLPSSSSRRAYQLSHRRRCSSTSAVCVHENAPCSMVLPFLNSTESLPEAPSSPLPFPSRKHPSWSTTLTERVDGRKERVQFDKITARVSRLCYGLDPDHVDAAAITMKVIAGVYQGVTTIQLDDLVRFLLQNSHGRHSLTPSGRRDRSIHDHNSPRLRYPRCAYRRLQPSQADQEAILGCHLRPLPLCQSKD